MLNKIKDLIIARILATRRAAFFSARVKNVNKVNAAEVWWHQRRPKIIENLDREVYGRVPTNMPAVIGKTISIMHTDNGNLPVIIKQL